jgi:hypothetical protein
MHDSEPDAIQPAPAFDERMGRFSHAMDEGKGSTVGTVRELLL